MKLTVLSFVILSGLILSGCSTQPKGSKPGENLTAKGTGRPKAPNAVDIQVDCSVSARDGGYKTVYVQGSDCEAAKSNCRGLSEGVVTSSCY
jgi:hypothetical protein